MSIPNRTAKIKQFAALLESGERVLESQRLLIFALRTIYVALVAEHASQCPVGVGVFGLQTDSLAGFRQRGVRSRFPWRASARLLWASA
jgi:hypothetical protein